MSVATVGACEVVYGVTEARLFTPPRIVGPPGPCGCGCALTRETSYGFAVVDFARDTLGMPLDPWQRFAVIHAGELLPDGRPRFRRVIIVVARQNGKTHMLIVLTLFWLFVEELATILGTSTQTKYAKEPWQKSHDLAVQVPELDAEIPRGRTRGMRKAAGQEEWWTTSGARYVIAASNEEGGRSLTLDRVVADELSRQFDYGAYAAAYYAMRAVPGAQYFGLTTPLDARSTVFNDLRTAALDHIEHGDGDDRLGLLEWSADDKANPLDAHALAQANPNAGHRFPLDDLLNDARAAVRAGGKALITFKTESMCITAKHTAAALDAEAWADAERPGGLDDLRSRVAMVVDVALSMQHVTLYAAAVDDDGVVRVDFVHEWSGPGCADRASRELPGLIAKMRVRPRVLGWLPAGPAAALAAGIADRQKDGYRTTAWPPAGVKVEEIRGELTAVCMGFEQLVVARRLIRSTDPLLAGQGYTAEPLPKPSGGWVFSLRGEGDCDALYAAAAAAFLAQTMPAAPAPLRIVVDSD